MKHRRPTRCNNLKYTDIPDEIYVDDERYLRYYHNNQLPTTYFVSNTGKVFNIKTRFYIRPELTVRGYHKINIYLNGCAIPVSLHKMVGIAWLIDSYVPGYDIDHIDGNKTNNSVDNLEWVTRKENIRRSFKLGLSKPKNGSLYSKYPDEDIIEIINLINDGFSISEACKIVPSIPQSYVYTILRGESRAYLLEKHPLRNGYKRVVTRERKGSTTIENMIC